ncbi:MAG: hypothetical protein E6K18_07295 [Methanobacteriota archaeon]|nr:MAG: hypothetical protein E6K18_07295 [Euryarchaeota archaeon]
MRPVLVIIGLIVVLMGATWALQGAYLLPATFMRGPEWIAIGGGVAILGLLIAIFGIRRAAPAKPAPPSQ